MITDLNPLHNMIKNIVITVLVLIVVAVGAWFAFGVESSDGTKSNAEAMRGNATTTVIAQDIEYFDNAVGYFVRPEPDGNYPGVVMIHENRGLRPEIKDAAESLAQHGYLVLAVDLFGETAEDQTGARALTANYSQAKGVANMRAAADYLRAQGADRIASLGWCFGGRQSVELALSGEQLDATVVYYGSGIATTTSQLEPIEWPVLGIFGDQDQVIPVATVRAFETSLNELGIDNEIYVYPGVGHAFANPSGANYAPAETADAWDKTLAFLERSLR